MLCSSFHFCLLPSPCRKGHENSLFMRIGSLCERIFMKMVENLKWNSKEVNRRYISPCRFLSIWIVSSDTSRQKMEQNCLSYQLCSIFDVRILQISKISMKESLWSSIHQWKIVWWVPKHLYARDLRKIPPFCQCVRYPTPTYFSSRPEGRKRLFEIVTVT